MIIKSTTRKDTNFEQIIAYLHKERSMTSHAITYVHNIDVFPDDLQGIVQALRENDQYRRKRKNSVGFYHDIISFAPEDSTIIKKNPWLLRDLVEQYIQLRCPHALAVARVHWEEGHVHIHVVISANEREGAKSTRISQAEFAQVKDQLGAYREKQYPELQYSYRRQVGERASKTRLSTDITLRMDKASRKQPKKAQLRAHLIRAITLARTTKEFQAYLESYGIKIYHRQDRWGGVVQNNRKYRFMTLLYMDEKLSHSYFQFLIKRITDLEKQKIIVRTHTSFWAEYTLDELQILKGDMQRLKKSRYRNKHEKGIEKNKDREDAREI